MHDAHGLCNGGGDIGSGEGGGDGGSEGGNGGGKTMRKGFTAPEMVPSEPPFKSLR